VKTKSLAPAKLVPRKPVPVLSVAPAPSLTTRTESLVVIRVATVVPVPPSFRAIRKNTNFPATKRALPVGSVMNHASQVPVESVVNVP
jgi:hypothetical protein